MAVDRRRYLFRVLTGPALTALQSDIAQGKLFTRVRPADVKVRLAQIGASWWLGVIVPNARVAAFEGLMPGTGEGWLLMGHDDLDASDGNMDSGDAKERVLRALLAASES